MAVFQTPTGFMTAIDPRSARRQLHMSAGVLVVLAVAIVAVVFAVRPQRAIAVEAAPTSTRVILAAQPLPALLVWRAAATEN